MELSNKLNEIMGKLENKIIERLVDEFWIRDDDTICDLCVLDYLETTTDKRTREMIKDFETLGFIYGELVKEGK